MTPDRTIYLICNAHLDPVWLWEWEEGAATVLSTFRTAADLCEAFPGFVFNHNEAILYQWVEEYEPQLFARIQRLVQEGKWHIMGGWHLQPDCNMPSGESFVRQILLGRRYFSEKFNARPTTAINFDPFGHTRGLVQILRKSGYDSYIVCRPTQEDAHTPGDEFTWEGYDGSQVVVLRPFGWYNSALGKAREKAERFISQGPQTPQALMLWGVGDHGGGPSRKDVADLDALIAAQQEVAIRHATPEEYFAASQERRAALPVHKADMNPWAVGCYTSMIRIKQKHRQLENELYASEKMACAAWARGQMAYPQSEFAAALYDLATCEFHDILPGSSIQPAEEMALRILDHGLESVARAKTRAFFALAQGQPAAQEGEIPVLVYNPHPFPVQTIVECEFNLQDFNWTDTFTDLQAFDAAGRPLPTQVEKEVSNLNLDWRKRVAFAATLEASQMNRFNCRPRPQPLQRRFAPLQDDFHLKTDEIEVTINRTTGLLDRYRVYEAATGEWVDYIEGSAGSPLVMLDNSDPWGMLVKSYRNLLGAFSPLQGSENQRFAGVVNPALGTVRLIEDGEARCVVEAALGYNDSRVLLRYKLPKRGREIEIEVRVHWNEKDRLLKLAFPTPDKHAVYMGQVAFGVAQLPSDGNEAVAQKWTAVVSPGHERALTIINDGIYASDYCHGEARLTLLRSPGYSVHPIGDRPMLPNDRYSPRMDQGERLYRFWLQGGRLPERLALVDGEALAHNERPMALSFFPQGTPAEAAQGTFLALSDPVIQLSALKKAESAPADGAAAALVVRLFNPTNARRSTTVTLAGAAQEVSFQPFEIRTFVARGREWEEVNLVEEGGE